jgi:HK97 family phage major capsid protein
MRQQINALKEKRAGLFGQMRELTVTAESEERDLTPEEAQTFDRLEGEAEELGTRAARMEKMLGLEGEMPKRKVLQVENPDDPENPGEVREFKSYTEWRQAEEAVHRRQDDHEYRVALYRYMSGRSGQAEMNHVVEERALSKASAAAGGNLVPTSFRNAVIEKVVEFGVMRELATIITTDSGEEIKVPTETTAGVATWTAENAAFGESDDAFGQTALNAYKATRLSKVSDELLLDAFYDLEAHLVKSFGRAFGILFNTGYVVGDGTGKATGITTQTTAGKVGTTGQTLTVTADDLMDLFHSVLSPYRRNGSWLLNDGSIKVVRKLKTGVSGDNTYLWQPGLAAGQPDTLLGRPVFGDPDVPVMAANAKSILFGDFSAYTIRDAAGLALQRLNELYSANGQVGFRGFLRTDGKLTDTSAVRHYANSAT